MILQNLICVPLLRNWLLLWYHFSSFCFKIFYRWCEFPHTPSSILADLVAKTKLHDQIVSPSHPQKKANFPGHGANNLVSAQSHHILSNCLGNRNSSFLFWLQPAGRKRSGRQISVRTKYQIICWLLLCTCIMMSKIFDFLTHSQFRKQ